MNETDRYNILLETRKLAKYCIMTYDVLPNPNSPVYPSMFNGYFVEEFETLEQAKLALVQRMVNEGQRSFIGKISKDGKTIEEIKQ